MQNTKQIQSDTITYLRFTLIVLVVFFHAYQAPSTMYGAESGLEESYPIYDFIRYFLSRVMGRIAVPMFLFFSGFLFFANVTTWDAQTYISKLKKRFHSLLIPYLFWNFLIIFIFLIAENTPYVSNLFSGDQLQVKDYGLKEFLLAFWTRVGNNEMSHFPFTYQFGFIRDLIVIIILSPLVHLIIKRTKLVGLVALFLCWFLGLFNITGLGTITIFFFSAGAYMGMNKINLVEQFDKIRTISFIAFPLIAMINILAKNILDNSYINDLTTVLGIIFLFNAVSLGLRNKKLHISSFLSSSSFFVFAAHEPWLAFLRKLAFTSIQPTSEMAYLFIYFLPTLLIISICLLAYRLMQRYSPKVLAIISGGR